MLAVIAIAVSASRADSVAQGRAPLVLWYDKPAVHVMNEAVAVGNGRMGGLVTGDPAAERIVFNEDSLWTGDENPSGDYETMGAYQVFGEVRLKLPSHDKVSAYRRDLDIGQAVAHVSYESGGVHFRRECFCSHPAQVLVLRLSADKPGACTGGVELADAHHGAPSVAGNRLSISGSLDNGRKYEAQLLVLNDGGTVRPAGEAVEFHNCDAVTLLLAAGTDYVMDYGRRYRGDDPHPRVSQQLEAAAKKPYEALKAEHLADFRSLFDRTRLDLGESPAARRAMPTDARRVEAAKSADPELEALLFQYGRYLLISCSRPGSLPANLQGLWNDSNNPPWHCDYHTNVNIEMNYWPAEVCNMAECHLPLFDLLTSQLDPWRKATASSKEWRTPSGQMTARGWAVRTSHNIDGGMGWNWDQTANAWYCQHLWEHYAFGGDKEYLRRVAYPVMKETCQFWEDHLKPLPDGRLVVPRGWSPEHGPHEDGVSYNQELVWDLFNNFVEAADALVYADGTSIAADKPFRDKVASMRDHLVTPGTGSWGQLLEWMTEKHDKELDTPNDHHRHTSHLFAVYPGRQISPTRTPALAKAAKVSLVARGDTGDVREWSFAWRAALYARLLDGEAAHRQLQQLFSDRNTCPNLFGLHPPMQMDGNFGASAAVAEMLLQSQDGEVHLLPALPPEWPSGSVQGLRARGGFEVDVDWKDGKLTAATIRRTGGANGAAACRVRHGEKTAELQVRPGESRQLDADLRPG